MNRCMGVVACVAAAWVGVEAQAQQPRSGTSAWLPVDAGAMCAMMSKELRGVAVRDRVTVTAAMGVEKKTESFEVFITPVEGATPRLDLVLGPLHVRADGGVVRAVHSRNAGTVFEAEVVEGKSTLDVIAEVLPPIPMPQVWLAMAENPEGVCPALGAYIGKVEWVKGEMSVDVHPAQVRMYGRAEGTGAAVEVYATVEPVRIERVVVTQQGETSAMEIRIEPVEAGALPPEDALEGRERVGSVGELVEKK